MHVTSSEEVMSLAQLTKDAFLFAVLVARHQSVPRHNGNCGSVIVRALYYRTSIAAGRHHSFPDIHILYQGSKKHGKELRSKRSDQMEGADTSWLDVLI
jgi:hypothetical protein